MLLQPTTGRLNLFFADLAPARPLYRMPAELSPVVLPEVDSTRCVVLYWREESLVSEGTRWV